MPTVSTGGYTAVAKLLHWVIAAAVLTAVPVAIAMVRVGSGPLQNTLYDLHRSLGVLILVLMLIRLFWRLYKPAPPLVEGLPPWQAAAARATHWLLYAALLAMPLLGWAGTSAFGAPITVFGLFEWPAMLGKDQQLAGVLLGIHTWLGFAATALVILHVGAALHHHFVRKDDTLRRMMPGYRAGAGSRP